MFPGGFQPIERLAQLLEMSHIWAEHFEKLRDFGFLPACSLAGEAGKEGIRRTAVGILKGAMCRERALMGEIVRTKNTNNARFYMVLIWQ